MIKAFTLFMLVLFILPAAAIYTLGMPLWGFYVPRVDSQIMLVAWFWIAFAISFWTSIHF